MTALMMKSQKREAQSRMVQVLQEVKPQIEEKLALAKQLDAVREQLSECQ